MTKGRATNAKANRTCAVRKTTAWRQARTGEARPRRLRRTRARWKQSASKASKRRRPDRLGPILAADVQSALRAAAVGIMDW